MASDKKMVETRVESIVEEIKNNPSKRFSKADFQVLVYGVLADSDFKGKKYLLRNQQLLEEEVSYNQSLKKFLDKLLKHAGMTDSTERAQVIETFEYSPKDLEWVSDAVDEAMFIYSECDKNMRIFRDKMLQLTVKKIVRSGKYDGKISYKKQVVDRSAMLDKKKK